MQAHRIQPFVIVFGLLCGFTNPAYADVSVANLDDKGRFARIEITGEISRSDVKTFANIVGVLSPRFEVVDVELNSPGGDVLAAMEIGNLVRKEWMWTTAPDDPGTECASACVFIFAAGARRIAGSESKIGIHRPHFEEQLFSGLDRDHAQVKYDQLSQSVQAYLAKMGMSGQLFIEMMRVPSNKIRMLSYQELNGFSLVGEDPGYDEWVRAKNVAKYGEQKMKEFDAWLDRRDPFVTQCQSSGRSVLDCNAEFDRRYPNPVFTK